MGKLKNGLKYESMDVNDLRVFSFVAQFTITSSWRNECKGPNMFAQIAKLLTRLHKSRGVHDLCNFHMRKFCIYPKYSDRQR